jgi:hypothetical protein
MVQLENLHHDRLIVGSGAALGPHQRAGALNVEHLDLEAGLCPCRNTKIGGAHIQRGVPENPIGHQRVQAAGQKISAGHAPPPAGQAGPLDYG